MNGCMGRSAFPTYLTLNCTELTSCYYLLELLVIGELSIWTLILIERPLVRVSVRYILIHFEDSNSTYVNYIVHQILL